MPETLRAGVIGASGIGKHHAKWLNAAGCEVSFCGTSAQSVEKTAATLRDAFGFDGRGYVGVQALLEAEKPSIIVVASPPELHPEHFLAAVEAGCHILCEKPLVWDADVAPEAMVGDARRMVEAAEHKGIIAGVNTQYVAAVEPYLELCASVGRQMDLANITDFFMRMDSRGGPTGATGEKIWVELAPHPLSVLVAFAGGGSIVPGSVTCGIHTHEVNAHFRFAREAGGEVEAHIQTCTVPEGSLSRRFGINGLVADYEGRNDEDGVYAAFLNLGAKQLKATDFMQASITRFVEAVRSGGAPAATIRDGLVNLQMQLQLLEAGKKQEMQGGVAN